MTSKPVPIPKAPETPFEQELHALQTIMTVLTPLTPDERLRVLGYVASRLGISLFRNEY